MLIHPFRRFINVSAQNDTDVDQALFVVTHRSVILKGSETFRYVNLLTAHLALNHNSKSQFYIRYKTHCH